MPVRKLLLYPRDEALLRQPSRRVPKVNAGVSALITDLKDTLETLPGAGLAAPQIGEHLRVVVVRFGQDEGVLQPPLALVNPVITETGPLQKGFDGCLSLPGISTWDSMRPMWLRFRALDEDGKPLEMRVEGTDALVVHHEVDHLDGVFFLDRLLPDARFFITAMTDDGPKTVPLKALPFKWPL